MFKNLKIKKFKNSEEGVTLIEIIVAIVIVVIFSSILIVNFPEIQRRSALSRATYKLAQDLRRAQDLGLSGIALFGLNDQKITTVKGYGIFVDVSLPESAKRYEIYADIADPDTVSSDNPTGVGSQSYDAQNFVYCDKVSDPHEDCIIETIDVSKENKNLYIKNIKFANSSHQVTSSNIYSTSINFKPPNPTVKIDNLDEDETEVGIVLGLMGEEDVERTVWVNSSGTIKIE